MKGWAERAAAVAEQMRRSAAADGWDRRRGPRPRVCGLPRRRRGRFAIAPRTSSTVSQTPSSPAPRRARPSRRHRALSAHVRRSIGTRTAGARGGSGHRPAPAVPSRVRDPRHHLDVPRAPAAGARPAGGQRRSRPPVRQRPSDLLEPLRALTSHARRRRHRARHVGGAGGRRRRRRWQAKPPHRVLSACAGPSALPHRQARPRARSCWNAHPVDRTCRSSPRAGAPTSSSS